jgi:hypothetical protein
LYWSELLELCPIRDSVSGEMGEDGLLGSTEGKFFCFHFYLHHPPQFAGEFGEFRESNLFECSPEEFSEIARSKSFFKLFWSELLELCSIRDPVSGEIREDCLLGSAKYLELFVQSGNIKSEIL